MGENLAFVPHLGTPQEYVPDVCGVPPGTHTYYVMKESLRPLNIYEDSPTRVLNSFVLATSFPDILPPAGREVLAGACGIFTRGEFLALRAFGNEERSLPLKGKSRDAFFRVIDNVAAAAPSIIYHRLTDYIADDFTFLPTPLEIAHLRGSGRLIADKALLEHELTIIERWKTAGKAVRVIIPYIANPEEQRVVQAAVAQVQPDQIGPMVDRVEQACNIGQYPPGDFVFPGPSDLTADVRRVKRGEYREGEDAERETLALVRDIAARVTIDGLTEILTAKILVGKVHVRNQRQVKDVYMPNQLISLKPSHR